MDRGITDIPISGEIIRGKYEDIEVDASYINEWMINRAKEYNHSTDCPKKLVSHVNTQRPYDGFLFSFVDNPNFGKEKIQL